MAAWRFIMSFAAVMYCVLAFGDAIDAHKSVMYHFAVTNTTDKPQMVESVRTSCACLKVKMVDVANSVPPGGVLPFEVVFNPAGMEGIVSKTISVKLSPSGETQVFAIAANVRLRLGFEPIDATFGVIRRNDIGREIKADLAGYMRNDVSLGTPYQNTGKRPVFDVRIGPDRRSVIAKFCNSDVMPGVYSEIWSIPTSDKEIPEIKFP